MFVMASLPTATYNILHSTSYILHSIFYMLLSTAAHNILHSIFYILLPTTAQCTQHSTVNILHDIHIQSFSSNCRTQPLHRPLAEQQLHIPMSTLTIQTKYFLKSFVNSPVFCPQNNLSVTNRPNLFDLSTKTCLTFQLKLV